MQILIMDLFECNGSIESVESIGHTKAMIDIQSNKIAIVELTGGRNLNFEIRLTEDQLNLQLVEIANRLREMGLELDTNNIYIRYKDM